jgi:glycolate oxidase FAD binding subunit
MNPSANTAGTASPPNHGRRPDDFVVALLDRMKSVARARPVGAGTKPALSAVDRGTTPIEMSGYRGIIEYEPSEFTFTARAGTPIGEIIDILGRHGQNLPFDPPLAAAGATLGGTVASGLNGPGRLRFGGMRDFVLGVLFATGDGRIVHGGGKVVKNAAGFDFPKLLVGSCGRLGVILELTFKVFPAPQATLTAEACLPSLSAALQCSSRLALLPLDIDALEIESNGRLIMRLAGDAGTLEPRLEHLNHDHGFAFTRTSDECWTRWASERPVKVPLTPPRIPALDAALETIGLGRRYGVAGNVAWIERATPELDAVLSAAGLPGLALDGPVARLGSWPGAAGERLIADVFDPNGRLGDRALGLGFANPAGG